MCAYIYIYMTCTHTHTHIYMYTCMHSVWWYTVIYVPNLGACGCVYTSSFMHKQTRYFLRGTWSQDVYSYTCAYVYICSHAYVYKCSRVYTCAYAYTCAYTYTYSYDLTCASVYICTRVHICEQNVLVATHQHWIHAWFFFIHTSLYETCIETRYLEPYSTHS